MERQGTAPQIAGRTPPEVPLPNGRRVMMETKVTIHDITSGVCALTQKEGNGLVVSFDDGTVHGAFLSWAGFKQLLALKAGQGQKSQPKPVAAAAPAAVPAGNGN